MSSYHFDPHDWRDKLPKGIDFYDFGGGQYQVPMMGEGSYIAASLVALVQHPIKQDGIRILAFKIPHVLHVGKNSDWGPIVDKMVARWNKSPVPLTTANSAPMPIVEDLFETPGPRPVEQTPSDPG